MPGLKQVLFPASFLFPSSRFRSLKTVFLFSLALFLSPGLFAAVRVLDDFNDGASGNLFGGAEAGLQGATGLTLVSTTTVGGTGFARGVHFNATAGFDGYASNRNSVDLSAYRYVSFWIRGLAGGENVYCLVDDGASFPKARVGSFIPDRITTAYQKVVISTAAFYPASLNWGANAGNFKIEANSDIASGIGTFYIDDIRFGLRASPIMWDNFNDGAGPFNYGASSETFYSPGGTAANIHSIYDNTLFFGATGYAYKVVYSSDANITDAVLLLGGSAAGLDLTGTTQLSFQIRGDAFAAGKNLGIGLKDAAGAESVVALNAHLSGGIPSSFQEARIPLSVFSAVNTAKVTHVQVWFQKSGLVSQTTGFTLHLDNLQFLDASTPTTPTVLLLNGNAVANGTVFTATNAVTVTADAGAADITLEHVGLEYSTNALDWFRIAADTDTSDASYAFTWHTLALPTGANYRLRAFSEDVQGNRGEMTAFSSLRVARSSTTLPASISDLTGLIGTNESEVTLRWTAPADDGTTGTVFGYVLKFSSAGPVTSAGFSSAQTYAQGWTSLAAAGQPEQRVLTALEPGVTYWFALKAEGMNGNFSLWNSSADVAAVNTLAFAPARDFPPADIASLQAAPASASSVRLQWNAPASTCPVDDLAFYSVYRSTASFSSLQSFVVLAATVAHVSTRTTTILLDENLSAAATYFYRVTASDRDPVLTSGLSNLVSTRPVDVLSGLTLTHEPLSRVGVLGGDWVLVALAESTRPITAVALYFRIPGQTTNYTLLGGAPPLLTSSFRFSFTVPKASVTVSGLEYYMTASDGFNQTASGSRDSPNVVSVGQGTSVSGVSSGRVTLNDGNQADGETSVDIPAGALASSLDLSIAPESILALPRLTQSGNLSAAAAFSMGPAGTKFLKPVTLTLRYADVDPRDGIVDGTNASVTALKIFWHDGITWRPLGGKVNPDMNTVTAPVQHFTTFALFPSGVLRPEDSKPRERILTPNGDGINDTAYFDNIPSGTTIRIFDMSGRRVRTLTDFSYWDGRDEDGRAVANGVYLYQFRLNFDNVSGTIAVAR